MVPTWADVILLIVLIIVSIPVVVAHPNPTRISPPIQVMICGGILYFFLFGLLSKGYTRRTLSRCKC